jgi:hypothetical protein
MDKKSVLVVWELPQVTEDPTAEVFDLETGEKIDEATINTEHFLCGGGKLIPSKEMEGAYDLDPNMEDQFLKDNMEFFDLPSVEERFLMTCFEDGEVNKIDMLEEIFKKYFSLRYNIKNIRRIREITKTNQNK